MTDWDYVLENIRRATVASERFQQAGEELINYRTLEEVQALAARLKDLQEELDSLLRIMSRGSQMVSDEIADTFSRLAFGQPSRYQSMPKPPAHKGAPEENQS